MRYLINVHVPIVVLCVHDPPVVLCVHDPPVVLCVHDPIVVLCVHDPPVGADPCVRPMSERHISADFAFASSLPFPSFASTSFADSVRPTVVGRTHGSAPTAGGFAAVSTSLLMKSSSLQKKRSFGSAVGVKNTRVMSFAPLSNSTPSIYVQQ